MIVIYTNWKSIIVRIFLAVLICTIMFLIINYGILSGQTQAPTGLLYLLCCLLTFLIINVVLSLFGIIKVQIEEQVNEITFSRFFAKTVIPFSEVTAYYTSVYNTNKGTTYGKIIKTKNNELRELNPGNLKDIPKIDNFLKNISAENLGEKRSYYPFTSGL